MSAPKVTDPVLSDPDVLKLRNTAEDALRDWLDAVVKTAVYEDVIEPDDAPAYVKEQQQALWEYADPVHAIEQSIFLWAGTDLSEWRDAA